MSLFVNVYSYKLATSNSEGKVPVTLNFWAWTASIAEYAHPSGEMPFDMDPETHFLMTQLTSLGKSIRRICTGFISEQYTMVIKKQDAR